MKKIKNAIGYPALLATLVLLSACGDKKEETKTSHEVAIQLEKVKTEDLVQPVYTSGLLFSETEAVLSFKIGGIIQQMLVKEGDAVRKGQLLAKLDQTEIEAQVIQARNGVDKAKRDLDRIKNLYADEAATLENVQDLTTAYNVAKESLRIATFNQRFAEIRAVSDGRIVKKMKNQGELVSSGMPIFFMNDTSSDQWKLEAGISDRDWARLTEGDQATLNFDAYPEESFEGRVVRLAEGADPTNGSYQVEVQVNPKGKKFAAGLFAKANITPSNKKTYQVIPVEALVEGFGKNAFVFVLQAEDKVKKIPVEVAFIQDNQVAIKTGLDNFDKVVTAGSGYLTEYSSIKVMEDTPPTLSSNN